MTTNEKDYQVLEIKTTKRSENPLKEEYEAHKDELKEWSRNQDNLDIYQLMSFMMCTQFNTSQYWGCVIRVYCVALLQL